MPMPANQQDKKLYKHTVSQNFIKKGNSSNIAMAMAMQYNIFSIMSVVSNHHPTI